MQLPFGLDLVSFLAGMGLVLVIAFAAFLINVWWRDATSPFRPQIVVQTTKRTPWQVVVGAFGALFQYMGFALVAAAAALLLFFGFSFTDVRTLGLIGLIFVIIGTFMRIIV